MTEPAPDATPTFADRLNRLFEVVAPPGRGPYSTDEVARAITASGVSISSSYIWLLRNGQRNNPTLRHISALAKFFGVPPAYFFDDQVTEAVDAELELLVSLRDAGVQRIALRAAGLSSESLHSISDIIERIRDLEGLSKEDGNAPKNPRPLPTEELE
ncbi:MULTISPECIES: helix-turn-helix domain-containing protein [Streptomyces]|uniref:XRE family transcriptional regulator n=2 Tax=Streptomyces TaxID=1883 RepID=A0A117IX98_9ACTN|nr:MULTISPECIES: helix-turn-helix domain-containing protein [Streptomyces]KUH39620.1 XRE family transcriptional regulator [Streptomyces kanasensis]UUS34120.1 helix-turn-helix domain-containing protein [Streptomyces changanensis]